MATNPMQRKARNSFLLGMLLMLVISAIIIGILLMLLINANKNKQEQTLNTKNAYVLNTSVKSGQIITPDMLVLTKIAADSTPANAITDVSTFEAYNLIEASTGAEVKYDAQNGLYYTDSNNRAIRVEQDGDKYYRIVNNTREEIKFVESPLIAKVNMDAKTALTLEMVTRSDEVVSSDLRTQEFNMIELPVYLNPDDYIDIRLMFPDGQDYIVVSKKRVIDVQENTVWLRLTEDEITTLSNAIVEAYMVTGSSLYANLYVEPGMQDKLTPTYPVSRAVLAKQLEDPNMLNTAKEALRNKYTQAQADLRNNDITNMLSQYAEEAKQNVEQKMQEERETREELRMKFIETME